MCTELPKVFVNRTENDRLMEEKIPTEEFYFFYFSLFLFVTVAVIQDYERECACKSYGKIIYV
jgi:hypothetical protein